MCIPDERVGEQSIAVMGEGDWAWAERRAGAREEWAESDQGIVTGVGSVQGSAEGVGLVSWIRLAKVGALT